MFTTAACFFPHGPTEWRVGLFRPVNRACCIAWLGRMMGCLWLLTGYAIGTVQAQGGETPSGTSVSEVGGLKLALSQPIRSVEQADSLLTVSRQLTYVPGEVVALCQLALQRATQQPEAAQELLLQAERLAPQITNFREASWAMSRVGRMQGRYGRTNPELATRFGGILGALGKALSNSKPVEQMADAARLSAEAALAPWAAASARRNPRAAEPDFGPLPPMPPVAVMRGRNGLYRSDFMEQLIDSLIRSRVTSPQVARQLTTRKQLRDSSRNLSNAYAQEGDYARAYQYYLQYTAYKDSLAAEATNRRIASLRYQQNLQKKETQIQLLTKDRQLRDQEAQQQRLFVLALVGCVALLLAFGVVMVRNNRAKQRANQQLNEQKETLQATLTDLKTAQAQLIHAEKMASLGELTAGIAHEIQNPLNFVNNFSEVSSELVSELLDSRKQPNRDEELESELLADVQQNLQKINQHGARAATIIRGMLEHARPTGGEKQPVDLNALVGEYLKLSYHGFRVTDEALAVQLTTDLQPGLRLVSGVPQELGRVLLNLFNNAFYAVQQRQKKAPADYQPNVTVVTKQTGRQVQIRVRDNGTGISAANLPKVFQPFFTTKPTGQGTGLGLSLSYDIITKGHGGTLAVASEEGVYTELTIMLPL